MSSPAGRPTAHIRWRMHTASRHGCVRARSGMPPAPGTADACGISLNPVPRTACAPRPAGRVGGEARPSVLGAGGVTVGPHGERVFVRRFTGERASLLDPSAPCIRLPYATSAHITRRGTPRAKIRRNSRFSKRDANSKRRFARTYVAQPTTAVAEHPPSRLPGCYVRSDPEKRIREGQHL
ncbi:hypothetical protein BD309DRAFT_121126 [Dichomitus squalens]|nr:hypothetical protein BD309DRAFT_121126 [Dichomitus squalens]